MTSRFARAWSKFACVEICRETSACWRSNSIERLQKLRLGAVERGLRLIHLQLVGHRLDDEERRAFFDRRAILVFDVLDEALHARDEIDGVDRRHISRGFKIGLHGLLQRIGDADLGRRRRHEGIFLLARREKRQKPE